MRRQTMGLPALLRLRLLVQMVYMVPSRRLSVIITSGQRDKGAGTGHPESLHDLVGKAMEAVEGSA